jgi:hypothetical protein
MDDKLSRVEDKLDKLDDRLDQMTITMVKNTELLDYHIKRTDALEDYVKEEVVKRDLEPIKKHVDSVRVLIKAISWVTGAVIAVAGFLLTLKQLGLF